MHNLVFSPIDPEKLISSISERVTANILKAVREQPHTESSEQLLSIDEAAEFLKLAKPTLYSKVSRGDIPYMKSGKRLYFSKTELIDYLKSGRKKSNEEIREEVDSFLSSKKKANQKSKK